MRRALATVVAIACLVGLLRHRVRRAGLLGGYRCSTCGRAFADLDDAGERGNGYVSAGARPVWNRDGAGGRGDMTKTTEIA